MGFTKIMMLKSQATCDFHELLLQKIDSLWIKIEKFEDTKGLSE
jgi:hypothetical protein